MVRTEKLAIFGGGGHGRVVAQIAAAAGCGEVVWIDDDPAKAAMAFDTFRNTFAGLPVALGIGDNTAREQVFMRLEAAGIVPLTLVHPSAVVADDAVLEAGCVVMPHAVVNTGARLGRGVIVNSGAVVEHDCVIGDFAHISPNAALAGGVCVGDRVHVGIGASVIQQVCIGADTVVGAGAAVVRDLPAGVTAVGVPAQAC